MKRSKHLPILASLGWSLFVGSPLWAGVITYQETIEDLNSPIVFLENFLPRDLYRTRTLGDGSPVQVLDDDGDIVDENAVNGSFGKWVAEPITYSHLFIPVGPITNFDSLILTIQAASVNVEPSEGFPPDFIELILGLGTPDDPVFGDLTFLDFFPSSPVLGESTFVFDTGDALFIELLLADGRLDVTITPTGPGFIGEPESDKIAVRSSTLSVTYNVPEPATVSLLPLALLAGFLRARTSGRRHRRPVQTRLR